MGYYQDDKTCNSHWTRDNMGYYQDGKACNSHLTTERYNYMGYYQDD